MNAGCRSPYTDPAPHRLTLSKRVIRHGFRTLTTAFTGVAAGLVVLLGSGQALAEVVQTSQAFENGIAGGGSFSADATATDAGQLSVETSATGGGLSGLPYLPLPIPLPLGPTSAEGSARVQQVVELTEGEYEVTVTFSGAVGESVDNCSIASATTQASLVGTYADPNGGEQGAVAGARFANLPGSLNTLVLTFTASFAGTVGLIIDAAIRAESTANGSGNSASAAVSVETTTIAVERIG